MASSTLQDIGALNDAAVYALVRGDIKEACAMLERALYDFHHNLGEEDIPHQEQEQQSRQVNLTEDEEDPFRSVRAIQIHPKLSMVDKMFSPENSFQIYDHAFLLPLRDAGRDDTAVTLLYNFAFVLQRKGILEGRHCLLHKSLKIYHMATSLLLDVNFENRNVPNMKLLYLATVANQGFLYSYKLEHDNACACAKHLHAIVQESALSLGPVDLCFFRRMLFCIEFFGLPRNLAPAA